MTKKSMLRTIMKEAKSELIKYNAVDSPLCILTPKNSIGQAIIIPPSMSRDETTGDHFTKIREICTMVDPSEVLVQSNTYLYENNSILPTGEALIISIEDANSFSILAQPYKKNKDGKIIWEKEVWEKRNHKNPGVYFEGLVQ